MEVCLCCYGVNFLIQVPSLSLGSRNKIVLVFGSENLFLMFFSVVMDIMFRFPKMMRTNLRTMSL